MTNISQQGNHPHAALGQLKKINSSYSILELVFIKSITPLGVNTHMLVDWKKLKKYYVNGAYTQHFFSDEDWPENSQFTKIWRKVLHGFKQKILCVENNQQSNEHLKIIREFRAKYKSDPIVVLFTGVDNHYAQLQKTFKDNHEKNIFFINDMDYHDENWFCVSTTNLAWSGFVGTVPFVPHNQRPFTVSGLCHRFEPSKWYFLAKLYLSKLNKTIAFSNHWNVDIDDFIVKSKYQLALTPEDEIISCLQHLLHNSPIRPEFLSDPRNNWESNSDRWQHIITDVSMHIRSRINLTLEGNYVETGCGTFLTEKTGKCLAAGTFPIAIGQSGTYQLLNKWGFRGFDQQAIDLSFDSVYGNDEVSRIKKIKKISQTIMSLHDNVNVEDCCKKNYDWFHDGWTKKIEKNNDIEIDRLRSKIKSC